MSADALAPGRAHNHGHERQNYVVKAAGEPPAEADQKVPELRSDGPDLYDAENGDEPDIAAINKVYRYVSFVLPERITLCI